MSTKRKASKLTPELKFIEDPDFILAYTENGRRQTIVAEARWEVRDFCIRSKCRHIPGVAWKATRQGVRDYIQQEFLAGLVPAAA